MEDTFKIYVDRLQDGEEETIEEDFPPQFLEIVDPELSFHVPVHVKGSALMSKGMLILHFDVSTEATMPCSICNQDLQVKIEILNFYHSEDAKNIRSGIFNFKELIREIILLEIPYAAECNQGSCPERENLAKYLRKTDENNIGKEEHPFADL